MFQVWMGISWYRRGTSHIVFTCLASDVWWAPLDRTFFGVHFEKRMWTKLTAFLQSPNKLLLYFFYQNHDKIQKGRVFSFNNIPCSPIFVFPYGTLKFLKVVKGIFRFWKILSPISIYFNYSSKLWFSIEKSCLRFIADPPILGKK